MKKYFILALLLILTILPGCSGKTENESDVLLDPPVEEIEAVPELPKSEPEEPKVSVEAEATPTDAPIFVDGNKANIRAYSINGNSYVCLRDLAYVLNGSRAQFEVGWNDTVKEISLTSNQSYTATGHELAASGTGPTTAWSIISPILLDGEETLLGGYTIGDDSYFSLRDMGEAFDFSVGWFGELGYIVVSTQKSHDEAPLTLEDEYRLIIGSKPLYDAGLDGLYDAVDGLTYADIIDFSNDGNPELLLVSVAKNVSEIVTYDIAVEVYGNIQGHACNWGTVDFICDFGEKSIELFSGDGKTFIGYHSWVGSGIPEGYEYYGIDNNSLTLVDDLTSERILSDEVNEDGTFRYECYYTSFDGAISEEAFQDKLARYTLQKAVLHSFDSSITFDNRGILPELPDITVTVNGGAVDIGSDLFLEKGYVMLPLRPIMEKAGVTVCANSSMNTILATTKRNTLDISDTFRMWGDISGEYAMSFNDESLSIGGNSPADRVEPRMVGGQLCVPIKPIVMRFGGEVTWDTPTKTYAITLDIPAADRMSLSEAQSMVEFSFEDAKQIAAQNGYVFTSHPADEWDCGQGFTNGKAYWWMYVLPAGITKDEANNLFWQGVDKYEVVTVWSDGTITSGMG